MRAKKISIVIPACNESGNIRPMLEALGTVLTTEYIYEIVFVDDGSTDNTLEILQDAAKGNNQVHYISFSRNFGHQNALKAGMDMSTGDCIITLDADLQHPPELIPSMIKKWEEGFDVVYTRRQEDQKSGFFKRSTSRWFYRSMRRLSGLQMESGIADFRLVSRPVADILSRFREPDLFLRGIIKWMGFKQYAIDYTPGERFSGTTKYSEKKMIKLALQGITSFSVRPLHFSIVLGSIITLISLLYIPYVIWRACLGHVVAGWASTIMVI
ncbi:MAG: glycosyltransferase family 2 protein, partial [Bacteroidales bacterium]|nr:glycosyltransferase family 2 protein [Bacteroidales bacterium]